MHRCKQRHDQRLVKGDSGMAREGLCRSSRIEAACGSPAAVGVSRRPPRPASARSGAAVAPAEFPAGFRGFVAIAGSDSASPQALRPSLSRSSATSGSKWRNVPAILYTAPSAAVSVADGEVQCETSPCLSNLSPDRRRSRAPGSSSKSSRRCSAQRLSHSIRLPGCQTWVQQNSGSAACVHAGQRRRSPPTTARGCRRRGGGQERAFPL